MNVYTVTVGILVIGLGLFFLVRSLHPESASGKLKAMIEMWGATRGVWLYRIAYVAIPLFFGSSLVYAGIYGVSLGKYFGA